MLRIYRKWLKSWNLAVLALQQIFCLRSRLVLLQWSLAPDKEICAAALPNSNFSAVSGIVAGLCALLPLAQVNGIDLMRLLPKEEKVQVGKLANGVTTFIQENSFPVCGAALRVIMQSATHEGAFFSLDTTIDNITGIEEFFSLCRDNCCGYQQPAMNQGELICGFQSTLDSLVSYCTGDNLAVIAVGDFSTHSMQSMIENYFGSLTFPSEKAVKMPIQVSHSSLPSGVALHLDYPVSCFEPKTYGDLKENWLHIFAQDLLQQRLERLTRSLREHWVHPHPRFVFPVHGFALTSEDSSSNILSLLLWEIEQIKLDGFNENEFLIIRERTAHQFHQLARNSVCTESAKIAAFYADGFRSRRGRLAYETFVHASEELVPAIKFTEVEPYVQDLLSNQNRFIHIRYPESHRSKRLTVSDVEEITNRIEELSDFEVGAYYEDDDIMLLDSHAPPLAPRQDSMRFKQEQCLLTGGDFDFSEPVINADGEVILVDPFDTLPISNSEKEIISYIVRNMAEKNIFELAFDKKKMEEKGKRINQVHPLRFIGYICSTNDLKKCLKRIKKSSFKWDAFIDGFAKRMKEESSKNNLLPYISGFSRLVNAHPDKITYFIQRKDWEGIVRYLM